MSKKKLSVAIPKIDRQHNIRYTTRAIMGLVNDLDNESAIRSMLEHDPHYVPIGKLAKASVEVRDEDFLLTTTIDDTHSTRNFNHQNTGSTMVEMTYTNDSRPFARHSFDEEPSTIDVRVDRANFQDWNMFKEFERKTQDPINYADQTGLMVRRSLIPEPAIQFFIDYPELALALYWVFRRGEKFLRYTIDKTARKVGDDLSEAISQRVRNVIGVYEKQRSSDDRNVTSHIVINAEPEINLLTKNTDVKGDTDISLSSLCNQMEAHKDILESAVSVTFARSSRSEQWQLRYIELSSGKVIATAECYDETMRDYNILQGALPVCLCLRHKSTRVERHFKTSARFTKGDEPNHYEMKIKPVPSDFNDWEMTAMALELEEESN